MWSSLRPFTLVVLLPSAVLSLTCYICATGGLGEFGECKEQFQYDCTPYASKFPGERTYCRTTREKHSNGTFNVMKECISETDHYSRFPEKGYPLEEECDLIDVHGQEVAYCVCRQSLCNRDPVADQFMAFEEKHPELFGEVESNSDSPPNRPSSIPSGSAPLALPADKKPSAAAFGAPQIVPPAIVPINAAGAATTKFEEAEIRRQPMNNRPQLPSREVPSINTGILSLSGISPVRQSGFVGTVGRDTAPTVPSISSAAGRLVAQPIVPPHVAIDLPPPVVPQNLRPTLPIQSKPSLRCIQCGERGLSDISSDCSTHSVLSCTQPDEICFTRMIELSPDKYAVEKMCVAPESVRAMFGDGAVNGECGIASQGKEHYCTCTTNECNRLPLHEQRGLRSPAISPPIRELPQPMKEPEPETPKIHQEIPKQRQATEIRTSSFLAPEIPTPKVEEKLLPIIPIAQPVAPRKKADLRCTFCQEEGITDPTADCQATATRDCREGQTMCLTQQTQLESDFRMEKRCVSFEEFANIVNGEPFEEGCATADEGMTNYCLCKGDKCNFASLLSQAQASGVRDALEQARSNKVQEELPRVPSREQPVIANGLPIHVETPRKTEEDTELELRRQQWAEADLNSVSSLYFAPFLLLLFLF